MNDTVYGSIIAAGIGLGATAINGLFKWLFERHNKEEERRKTLKREIYFPVLDAISEMVILVPKIPQTQLKDLEQVTISPDARRAFAKLQIAASTDVTRKATLVGKLFFEAFTSLIIGRLKMGEIEGEIAKIDRQLDDLHQLWSGLWTFLKQEPRQEHRAEMRLEIDEVHKKRLGLFEEKGRLLSIQGTEMRELQSLAFRKMIQLVEPQHEAMLAIRRDLGIPVNVDESRALMRDQITLISCAMEAFHKEAWDAASRDAGPTPTDHAENEVSNDSTK